jgi:hypothetical protein
MPFDLTHFSLTDMLRIGSTLRREVSDSESMEENAGRICRSLYDSARGPGGDRQCALVRLYKTHPFGQLPADLQEFARGTAAPGEPLDARTKCLVLLGTSGDEPAWNDRRASAAHRAIPLTGPRITTRAPMIGAMIRDFGLDVSHVVRPGTDVVSAIAGRSYGIFYVADARGSEAIPAQDFVVRHEVRSVIGFGGALRTGDLFAVILFTRAQVPREAADRFRNVALDVKSALFRVDPRRVFAPGAGAQP